MGRRNLMKAEPDPGIRPPRAVEGEAGPAMAGERRERGSKEGGG